MSLLRNVVACALFACAAFASTARADNWPMWRGPGGQGVTAEKNLPTKWSATENVKWKIELPDAGNSTPVVWGDKIFLTQATEKGKKRSLYCLDRKDGAKRWEKTVTFDGKETIHATNTYAAGSPATDGTHVVVSYGSAGTYCYDFAGKELWKKDFGPSDHIWGSSSSPVIYKGLTFLNFGPHEKPFLVALKTADGTQVWKNDEVGKKPSEYFGSWSTPVVATVGDRTELVMTWPGVVKSYDPETGKLLWSSTGLEKDGGAADRLTYTSPLVSEKGIFAAAGYGGAALGLKPGGSGDVTESHRLWRTKANPQRIGTGVIVGDHVYVVNEFDIVCLELATGKQLWSVKIGKTWGSVVRSGDTLYLTSENAETRVFRANPKEYDELARNPLDGATTRASVVPSDGELLIRTYKHLWCIGAKK